MRPGAKRGDEGRMRPTGEEGREKTGRLRRAALLRGVAVVVPFASTGQSHRSAARACRRAWERATARPSKAPPPCSAVPLASTGGEPVRRAVPCAPTPRHRAAPPSPSPAPSSPSSLVLARACLNSSKTRAWAEGLTRRSACVLVFCLTLASACSGAVQAAGPAAHRLQPQPRHLGVDGLWGHGPSSPLDTASTPARCSQRRGPA